VDKKQLLRPAILGLSEGVLLVIIHLGLQWIWVPFIQYNDLFTSVQRLQEIILICLVCLGSGYLSLQVSQFPDRTKRDTLIISALTGGVAGLLLGIAIRSTGYMPILAFFIILLPLSILLIAFLHLCIPIWNIYSGDKTPAGNKDSISNTKRITHPVAMIVLVCFLILALFPGLSYAGIVTGEIEHKYDCGLCVWFDFVSVERSGVDSVKISLLTEDPSTAWIPLDKRPGFTILINGNDVSNATAIQKQGITMTIDPPEGLKYQKGSLVVLKGNGISNVTSPVTLKIIESFPKVKTWIIYEAEI
jgi:hypothetical protein